MIRSHSDPASAARGNVAAGFEAVRDVFAGFFEKGWDTGSAVSVYVGGEPVVRLTGGARITAGDPVPYDADTIQRKFKRAVTDSGTEIRFDPARPAITNLLEIFHLITDQSTEQVEERFAGKGYAQLKGDLAEVTVEFLRPIQQRLREISDEQLDEILRLGRDKAGSIARVTLDDVFERTGLKSTRA